MPATNGFQLVPSDLAMLQHVHELRLATIEHVAALSGRSYKRTQERLAKLEERAYLKCITRRPQKLVYAVGREGVETLIEHGYAPQEIAHKRLRQTELKDLGIKHAIFIADIHVRLLQITASRALALTTWREGPSLWDSVTTSQNVRTPIRPDALFSVTVPPGQARAHFFLEADRGTMAHSRMREKVMGYAAYFQQQRHVKKYAGMKVFRVLTLTETRGRAQSLAAEYRAMMPAGWLAAYPVIAFEDLKIESLMPELAREAGV